MKQRVPLIVDPDKEFLSALVAESRTKPVQPLTAFSGKDAQLVISDPNNAILSVFINSEVDHPHALSVIRCTHLKRPGIPVYMIQNKADFIFSPEQVKELGIQKILVKPISYAEIIRLVMPSRNLFEASDALQLKQQESEPTNQELHIDDQKFVPIIAQNYLAGSISYFDVYVRVSAGNYIKILKAGDAFTEARVVSYLKKGVVHFYMRKDAQEQYLRYCDKLTSQLVQNDKVPMALKMTQTMNHGQEMMRFMYSEGMSESNLNYAAGFLENVQHLVKKFNLEENAVIRDFMKNLVAYDHGVATCLMTSVVLKAFKFEHEGLYQTVGLASLFHDIGITQLPEEIQNFKENEALMTAQQSEIFRTHPAVGAKLLKGVYGINETVCQIIEQHHMKRGGDGFPQKSSTVAQLQMSEVVGFSDEISNLMSRIRGAEDMGMLVEFKKRIPNRFSNSIVSVLGKIFGGGSPAAKT